MNQIKSVLYECERCIVVAHMYQIASELTKMSRVHFLKESRVKALDDLLVLIEMIEERENEVCKCEKQLAFPLLLIGG